MELNEIPKGANIIGSHFLYKVKAALEDVYGNRTMQLKLKSRLCVYSNTDAEPDSLRIDVAVVSHMGFRLVYAIVCVEGIIIGKADIRGAYTQSGGAKQEFQVKEPFRYVAEK